MRSTVVFALALFTAAAAAAQVAVSDEVVSDPLQIHMAPLSFAAPAVSLAKDSTGVAIAWTMGKDLVERIYVARLDPAGHVTGTVREIPLSVADSAHAVYPSIAPAPGGSGFLLAWLELDPLMPAKLARAVFCRLDAALTPAAPVTLFPAVLPAAPALVRTKGAISWISAGGFLWSLAQDGTMTGPFAGMGASDMTIATDLPQLVGSHSVKSTSYSCKPDAGCITGHTPGITVCLDACKIYPFTYSLDFTALLTTSVMKTFNFNSDAQPAIESDGRDVLLAWFRGAQASGGDVVTSRLSTAEFLRFSDAADHPSVLAQFPPDAGETRPDIATDGQRYVVVWRSRTAPGNHDIVGMAIDGDGKLTPLSIATSSIDERDPAILYVGGGTYLAGYEKVTGLERRIAGRFVTFGRRRTAR